MSASPIRTGRHILGEEASKEKPLRFTAEICIEASVIGRLNAAVSRRYFAATIEPKDPGFLPKSILIADDLFKPVLHTGTTFNISGHIVNQFYRFPPVMFPDYQTLAPQPSTRLPRPTNGKTVLVNGTATIVHRFDQTAFNDIIVTVQHRDYDPSALVWVDFHAQYICGPKHNEHYESSRLQVGYTVDFEGYIEGFCEYSNTWLILATYFKSNAGIHAGSVTIEERSQVDAHITKPMSTTS